jgi:ribosomal protein L37AE/L43A
MSHLVEQTIHKHSYVSCADCATQMLPSEFRDGIWWCPNCGVYSDTPMWDVALDGFIRGLQQVKLEEDP